MSRRILHCGSFFMPAGYYIATEEKQYGLDIFIDGCGF